VPNGFGPGAWLGCTILLSVGRVLLLNGMMSSSADISTVRAGTDDFAACGWPIHDWLDIPALWVDAQQTMEAELTTLADGTWTALFRRLEERSRTDDFVTADAPDEATDDGSSCDAPCDL